MEILERLHYSDCKMIANAKATRDSVISVVVWRVQWRHRNDAVADDCCALGE